MLLRWLHIHQFRGRCLRCVLIHLVVLVAHHHLGDLFRRRGCPVSASALGDPARAALYGIFAHLQGRGVKRNEPEPKRPGIVASGRGFSGR